MHGGWTLHRQKTAMQHLIMFFIRIDTFTQSNRVTECHQKYYNFLASRWQIMPNNPLLDPVWIIAAGLVMRRSVTMTS